MERTCSIFKLVCGCKLVYFIYKLYLEKQQKQRPYKKWTNKVQASVTCQECIFVPQPSCYSLLYVWPNVQLEVTCCSQHMSMRAHHLLSNTLKDAQTFNSVSIGLCGRRTFRPMETDLKVLCISHFSSVLLSCPADDRHACSCVCFKVSPCLCHQLSGNIYTLRPGGGSVPVCVQTPFKNAKCDSLMAELPGARQQCYTHTDVTSDKVRGAININSHHFFAPRLHCRQLCLYLNLRLFKRVPPTQLESPAQNQTNHG